MTTKRSRKQTGPIGVEAAEDEVSSTEPEAIEPEEVEQAPEQEPQRKALPGERRCPSHHELFPEESEVRPISEFRVKDDRVQPTYCRRCTNRLHVQRNRDQATQKYTMAAWAADLADLLRRALNEGFLLEAMADEVNALLAKDPRPQRQEPEAWRRSSVPLYGRSTRTLPI
jgi:hypothetical protein